MKKRALEVGVDKEGINTAHLPAPRSQCQRESGALASRKHWQHL